MRKKRPPTNAAPAAASERAAEEGLEAERWESAFESPDDLWMRFLARAEADRASGLELVEEWLSREHITMVAEREWQLLLGSRPTPGD